MREPFVLTLGDGASVAAAIHAGHEVRPEVAAALYLAPAERLREEDPFTDRWVEIAPSRIVARRSRFEVDLNRPRDQAVYRRPEDAWGLEVWRTRALDGLVPRSLEIYDEFYRQVAELLGALLRRQGRFVVLDLHSYNHRRQGRGSPPAAPAQNPDLNLGTGSLDRRRWGPVADAFMEAARGSWALGRRLEVAENVRFRGGHFAAWVNRTFPERGCALAIEVKKFFMDEWTGIPDSGQLEGVRRVLEGAAAAAQEALERC
jgi:N-formylglutamate deformylase